MVEKNILDISGTTKPMAYFLPVLKLRAVKFGVYDNASIAATTRAAVSGETTRVPFIT